jgi:hypothetical protein
VEPHSSPSLSPPQSLSISIQSASARHFSQAIRFVTKGLFDTWGLPSRCLLQEAEADYGEVRALLEGCGLPFEVTPGGEDCIEAFEKVFGTHTYATTLGSINNAKVRVPRPPPPRLGRSLSPPPPNLSLSPLYF